MNSRERLNAVFQGQIPDRIPLADCFWKETIQLWHGQGLPEGTHPCDFFDFDIRYAYFINTSPMFNEEVIEINNGYQIRCDQYGRKIKTFAAQNAPPSILSWPVRNKTDWGKLETRLIPNANRISFGYFGDYWNDTDRPTGFDGVRVRYNEIVKNDSTFILLNVSESYETIVSLLGDECLLLMMVESPDFVKKMFDTISNLIIATLDLLLKNLPKPDGVFLGGDIAYRNGPFFSPGMYRNLLMPAHSKVCNYCRDKSLPLIYHTDGNFLPLAADLIASGVSALQPLEAQAGIEAGYAKEMLGRHVVLMGNISAPKVSKGGDSMREEIHGKLPILMKGGGYIYHSDHSIPPNMNFNDYCELVEIIKEKGRY